MDGKMPGWPSVPVAKTQTGRLRLVAPPRMARRRDGERGPPDSIINNLPDPILGPGRLTGTQLKTIR
jgi:hypothetical protein